MTTVVKKEWFGACETDQEAQLIANTMAVTPEYFADVSCEGDRLFGLVTVCKRETCQETCETVLNGCARETIWRYLYMVQQELEATLHWTLGKRYITETLAWDGESHLQLTFGGVDELMVVETFEQLDSNLSYNPYVYRTTAVVVAGQTYTEVLIPVDNVNTPEGIMLVNVVTGAPVPYASLSSIAGYPQFRSVLGVDYWVLAIPGGNADPGDEFDVLDCVWGYVDVSEVLDCDVEDDEWALVYNDTVQKIKIAKKTDERWYIRHRDMIRLEYIGDEIDLTQLQLYKLMPYVDVGCFGESCELVTIRRQCKSTEPGCDCETVPCNVTEANGCATIINARAGIIRIEEVVVEEEGVDGACPTFRQKLDCDDTVGSIYEVVVSYRTNPAGSGIDKTSAVETLRRAIVSRVAAEVPLTDCGCNVECGFFKEMRVFRNTTTFTETATIVAMRYGNKVGQIIYSEALQAVPRDQRVGIA